MEDFIEMFVIGIIIIILILSIVCLSRIESYGSKVGTVVDKEYASERSYTTTQIQYVGNNTIQIPKYHHEPAKWKLKLQKTENDKTKEIWIEVTEEEYNNIKIGEFYGE